MKIDSMRSVRNRINRLKPRVNNMRKYIGVYAHNYIAIDLCIEIGNLHLNYPIFDYIDIRDNNGLYE